MDILINLTAKVKGKDVKIVFPEATDVRVLGAAIRLKNDEVVEPVLVGSPEAINTVASENGWDASKLTVIDPTSYYKFEEMVASFVERRNGKATEDQARTTLLDPNYFGTMLVHMGIADGMVSGAIHSTGDTVRPALQIIKTKPGVSRTSGAFLMIRGEEKYVFSDCAININPDAQALGEIAVESARTAEMFDIEPRVAMLSFSTKGSAASEEVTKVAEATKIAQELAPQYQIDGELQFDAAFVPSVGAQKAPESEVAGKATVYVFPEIQSGNIGYKIAQRFGGFEAVGPILQGLNKPISDLSRGCNEEDVYKLAIITAAQYLMDK
ncbi:phosphate acetyltransferase [Vagococcus xieshaowenii]|uniref:Phosphate acetyltransferase n=1 Tax=Vagococcus xieshaowenii TaxID=2562451 RepID=A0AAJ5JKP3_9ENTE|nr:phosphate acetyltransferase [Vagococcus xieshaowenii]QCA29378.1 phosphate acetyltransferase [Vagococcus xieshaowenii]TFZ39371.1 phosphate acetyltransferase [Vagococcus xieshaowenii]